MKLGTKVKIKNPNNKHFGEQGEVIEVWGNGSIFVRLLGMPEGKGLSFNKSELELF